jgi:hypothetical protein
LTVEAVKALVSKRQWRVAYRYIPRIMNAPADDMCRRSRELRADVAFLDGHLPEDAPPLQLTALYAEVRTLEKGPSRVHAMSAGAM